MYTYKTVRNFVRLFISCVENLENQIPMLILTENNLKIILQIQQYSSLYSSSYFAQWQEAGPNV